MKKFLKTTKGKITMAAVGVAAVAAVVVAVLVIINNNKYRSISVADVKGIVNIIGQKNNGQAYKGQRLFDGDDVSVMQDSELTLCLNNDKYVYADENTHFTLEAASSRQGNKLKIVLDKGSELNVLTAKLGDGDTYQVDTPNSTMSVRGTRFRMTVYKGDDGYTYTLLEVESGVVLAQLKTLTGDYNGVEKEFYAGESALIRGGDDFSEFVISDSEDVVWILDHNSLPSEAVSRLIEVIKKSEELEAAKKEAEEKAIAEAEEKEKAQVAEKDTDKDKDADKDTDADKDADKDSKDKDAKDKDAKDSKDGKDAKDSKDNKDNKDTAKDNNDANNQANNGGEQNNNGGGGSSDNSQPAHTHTWGEWYNKPGEAPTCEAGGKRTHKCSGCGAEESEDVGPLGHKWEDKETPATCTSDGEKHQECSVCHAKQNSTVIPGGHKWEDKVTQPTCVNDGEKHQECSVCHATQNSQVLPATGQHDYQWVADPDSTCTTMGTEYHRCTMCGQSDEQHSIGYKHSYAVESKTDNGKGWNIVYKCQICGDSYTDFEPY